MNTTEIGTYIRNPQQLNTAVIDDLRKLCEDYPYSGLLHILYLKALGNAKALDFDQSLKQYAIKIPNRELLYHLIHEDVVQTIATQPEEKESVAETEMQGIESELIDLIELPQELLEEIETSYDADSLSDEMEEASVSEQLAELTSQDSEIQEIEQTTDSIEEADEQQEPERYSLEDVSWLDNTITFEGFTHSALDETEKEQLDEEESAQMELESNLGSKEDDSSIELWPNELPEKKSKQTFYDWLNAASQTSKNDEKKQVEKGEKQDEDQVESTTINVEISSDVLDDAQSESQSNIKEKTKALVDKFIETEPRISRPRATFFSPVKSAKESVREDGIPVSETLSKIYELQGNYPKAIAVLEKLCELIPQKTSEFENRIAEIKAKMEN